jgi:hypothetical protein
MRIAVVCMAVLTVLATPSFCQQGGGSDEVISQPLKAAIERRSHSHKRRRSEDRHAFHRWRFFGPAEVHQHVPTKGRKVRH